MDALQEAQIEVLETVKPLSEEIYRRYREEAMKDIDKFIITERIKKAKTNQASYNLVIY